jgi:hypothetical protein
MQSTYNIYKVLRIGTISTLGWSYIFVICCGAGEKILDSPPKYHLDIN